MTIPAAAPRTPVVARTRAELRVARADLTGPEVAVVMTMGALHDGHATLIRQAREMADHVIVTIFLNPLQFGPKEDLSRYPRTFDTDLEICSRCGADLVFAPSPDVVYPDGDPGVRISAGPLGTVLEGQSRPGHFDGMLTVVAKLMHLTGGTSFLYGQKDAQQLLLIRRMVRDLDVPARVAGYLLGLPAEGSDGTYRVRLPLAKKDIASWLATTPESFSRALARLERDGIVAVERDVVTLRDPDALDALANR